MRYGLLLGMALILGLSLPAMGVSVTETADSIIIGNATYSPGQNQVSVPIYFVTHGDITHYNLPLAIESSGSFTFLDREIEPALNEWDDNWQGVKNGGRQALELGFADLGGEDNPSMNTNGARVEAMRLIVATGDNADNATAIIRATVDERSGEAIFGYKGGVTGVVPVIIEGNLIPFSQGVPETQLPTEIALNQNYPNPFNPTTEIEYAIPDSRQVNLAVYNLLGQSVRTLVSERQDAGYHRVTWNGCDNSGKQVPSGTYLYKLQAGDFSQSMKMVMLK